MTEFEYSGERKGTTPKRVTAALESWAIHSINPSTDSLDVYEDVANDMDIIPQVLTLPQSAESTSSPTFVLSDLLTSISSKDRDEHSIVSLSNELITLFQRNPSLKHDINLKNFISKVHFMLYHKVSEVKALGYRLLRYVITDFQSLQIIIHAKVLIYVIVSFSTTNTIIEKEQALKLIRKFVSIENGCDNLSIGVIKCLISLINESPINQAFKLICLETICEISLFKPELIFHSGAFKLIIHKITDAPMEVSISCLLILLNTLDQPFARKFLRNGFDFISLISIFSEDKPNTLKLQKISFLLTIFLKTFNGILAFLIKDFQILDILLSNLKKNNTKVQDYIMDIIFDILRIKPLPWLQNSGILQDFNHFIYHNPNHTIPHDINPMIPKTEPERDPLADQLLYQYQGLLVRILVSADLMPALSQIVERDLNAANTRKASSLILEVYSLAQKLLPPELLSHKTLLPQNPYISLKFEKSSKESYLRALNNDHLKLEIVNIVVKSKFGMEDNVFRYLIEFTKILTIKEFEKWNWKKISLLIQGPLVNEKRFEEVLEKYPKVLKRLMSFFRPFKFRFCTVSIKDGHAKEYISVGCQLFKLFLSNERGIKYLSSNKIFPQMAEIFCQLDPASGITVEHPLLSQKRLETTVAAGYIRFIGVLSASKAGLRMLEQWQFFQILHNIVDTCEDSTQNNLFMMHLFKYVDFSLESQFRIILAKVINTCNLNLKTYIFNDIVPKLTTTEDCLVFIIKILVESLYNSETEVVGKSIGLLKEYFSKTSPSKLQQLIDLKLPIAIVSKTVTGRNLLMNLLGTSNGFRYLQLNGFIDEEFKKWRNLKGFEYLLSIESMIQKNLFQVLFQEPQAIVSNHYTHFFKHLLSTEDGYVYFSNQGYLKQLVRPILEFHDRINNDEAFLNSFIDNCFHPENLILLKTVKQNLWIIGTIGSGKYGIQLLDPISNTVKTNIFSMIIDFCSTCPIWQIRGISFYVLGMLASTVEGIEILDEMDWVSVVDSYGNGTGVVFPKNPLKMFNVQIVNPYRDIKYYSIFNGQVGNESSIQYESDEEDEYIAFDNYQKINERILLSISNLSSILGKIERKAEKELNRLKINMPQAFENVQLFLEVIKRIDKGNFNFEKRNFILNLFIDTRILELVIKRGKRGMNAQ